MKKPMTPANRQKLLKKAGVTQKAIAIELGISEMSVSREMQYGIFSHRTRCKIAEKIDLPVDRVFPEYYSQPPQRSTSKAANV
jgi:transcriptional regulator with XRE-family HTH domain